MDLNPQIEEPPCTFPESDRASVLEEWRQRTESQTPLEAGLQILLERNWYRSRLSQQQQENAKLVHRIHQLIDG